MKAHFSVHTPSLLGEILSNPETRILVKPLNIFRGLLGQVAERAAEINDAKLNALMADLTLYEVCDPYSKEFDAKIRAELIAGKHGIDATKR